MSSSFDDCLNDLVRCIEPELKSGFDEICVDFVREEGRLSLSLVDAAGRERAVQAPEGFMDALRALLAVQFPKERGAVDRCTVEIENGGDVHIDARFLSVES